MAILEVNACGRGINSFLRKAVSRHEIIAEEQPGPADVMATTYFLKH